jgi:hypothetical protein
MASISCWASYQLAPERVVSPVEDQRHIPFIASRALGHRE